MRGSAAWKRHAEAARRFVATADERFPDDKKLAILYSGLKEGRRYAADASAGHFARAEEILSAPEPAGNCEDFAATVSLISKVPGLPHRIWLGESGS